MECPQCGENEVVFTSNYVVRVNCSHCLYSATLGDYVQKMLGENYRVSHISSNEYAVTYQFSSDVMGDTLSGWTGRLSFLGELKSNAAVSVRLKVDKPSLCGDFVAGLKSIFGETLRLNVYQTGVDRGFSACPVCEKPDKLGRGNSGWIILDCTHHFEIGIMNWVKSVVLANSDLFLTSEESDYSFKVRRDVLIPAYFPLFQSPKIQRELVAEVSLRYGEDKTVLAVKFIGSEGLRQGFDDLLATLRERLVARSFQIIEIK